MNREFWDRFGAAIIFGSILALFVGLLVYGQMTQEIEQGDDKPMGRSSAR